MPFTEIQVNEPGRAEDRLKTKLQGPKWLDTFTQLAINKRLNWLKFSADWTSAKGLFGKGLKSLCNRACVDLVGVEVAIQGTMPCTWPSVDLRTFKLNLPYTKTRTVIRLEYAVSFLGTGLHINERLKFWSVGSLRCQHANKSFGSQWAISETDLGLKTRLHVDVPLKPTRLFIGQFDAFQGDHF